MLNSSLFSGNASQCFLKKKELFGQIITKLTVKMCGVLIGTFCREILCVCVCVQENDHLRICVSSLKSLPTERGSSFGLFLCRLDDHCFRLYLNLVSP